jgi:hypothetical protein
MACREDAQVEAQRSPTSANRIETTKLLDPRPRSIGWDCFSVSLEMLLST